MFLTFTCIIFLFLVEITSMELPSIYLFFSHWYDMKVVNVNLDVIYLEGSFNITLPIHNGCLKRFWNLCWPLCLRQGKLCTGDVCVKSCDIRNIFPAGKTIEIYLAWIYYIGMRCVVLYEDGEQRICPAMEMGHLCKE